MDWRYLLLLSLAGCRTLGAASAYTAQKTQQALTEADTFLAATEQTAEVTYARRDILDARERVRIFEMQFGPPPLKAAKLKRYTPDDQFQTDLHRALARQIKGKRDCWENIVAPLREAWSWFKWCLRWGPWILALLAGGWAALRVRRAFRDRDTVQVHVMEKTLPEGERAKIAAGTPLGRCYDRMHAREKI